MSGVESEGAYPHVLSRGNERRDIFFGDGDRRLFLTTLGEASDRFKVDVFAFVLMGNHYHLLLRTNLPNLSQDHPVAGSQLMRGDSITNYGALRTPFPGAIQGYVGGKRRLPGGTLLLYS